MDGEPKSIQNERKRSRDKSPSPVNFRKKNHPNPPSPRHHRSRSRSRSPSRSRSRSPSPSHSRSRSRSNSPDKYQEPCYDDEANYSDQNSPHLSSSYLSINKEYRGSDHHHSTSSDNGSSDFQREPYYPYPDPTYPDHENVKLSDETLQFLKLCPFYFYSPKTPTLKLLWDDFRSKHQKELSSVLYDATPPHWNPPFVPEGDNEILITEKGDNNNNTNTKINNTNTNKTRQIIDDHIIGMTDVRNYLEIRVLASLVMPKLFTNGTSNYLSCLFGVEGSGKKTTVHSFCRHYGINLLVIPPEIIDKSYDSNMFDLLMVASKELSPVIVYFDDCDRHFINSRTNMDSRRCS